MNPGIFWVYSVVKHSDDDIHLETQLLSQEENQDCRPTPDNWFMEVSPGFPPIAFLPAGKPFKGFSKTQELSALITAFPLSIFFFFNWQKCLSYLSSRYTTWYHSLYLPSLAGHFFLIHSHIQPHTCLLSFSQISPWQRCFVWFSCTYLRLYHDFSSFQEKICSHESSLCILHSFYPPSLPLSKIVLWLIPLFKADTLDSYKKEAMSNFEEKGWWGKWVCP